ncbi:MAG: antibiotic biosynthesis monooxygenase family protein [Geothrix sp.]|uniref:putative quinol monooxygenase n=1 Tax=Geothrix sp. TaxID=1962974 RepID=UPI003BAE7C4D
MVLTALLTAKPEKRGELHQTLFSLLGGIQGQPGCLECLAGQDLAGEPRFHLHLIWKDRASLEAFMAAEVFRILLGALQVLATSTEFRIVAAEDTFTPAELNRGGFPTLAPPSLPGPP